jgi:lysozyme family protein
MTLLWQEENWQYAIKKVLEHEGFLSDDDNDPGGLTKYGISLRFLQNAEIDIDGDGDSDEADIRSIRREDAIKIYKEEFWLKNHYYTFINKHVAAKIFDLSVNIGSCAANKLLQKSINDVIKENKIDNENLSPIEEDGICGKITSTYINLITENGREKDVLYFFIKNSAQYYCALVDKKYDFTIYIRGWLRRLCDI